MAKTNAINTPVNITPALAAVVGPGPLSRGEITKKIWEYIRAKGLQDEKNKRAINADPLLEPIFGKPQVTMLELPGLVSKQVVK